MKSLQTQRRPGTGSKQLDEPTVRGDDILNVKGKCVLSRFQFLGRIISKPSYAAKRPRAAKE
jgi:hypothetical protein